jgi:hypothetical protein
MHLLKNSKIGLGLLFLTLGIFSFFPGQSARADIAPPSEPPGSNISPGEGTQVQMLAETVQIDVQPVAYQSRPRLAAEFALANVKASFTMRNQGDSDEQMQVRFPLMDPSGTGDGFGNYPEIQSIQVRVNEKPVNTSRVTTPTPNTWDQNAPPIAWAAFNVDFPVGRKVSINVQYNLQPTGYFPVADFVYILETGAGWFGPIGSADLSVSLPYDVNTQNLLYGDYNTTPGGQADGQQITWHYENLEPTQENNLRVDIVAPKVWMDLLHARQAAQTNSGDANAWQALAQAAATAALDESGKGWLRTDPAGQALALESQRAYEQVLALRSKDPSLWAGYENLMVRILMQIDYPSFDKQPSASDPDLQKLVKAINQVLALDPQNEEVKSDAQWVADTYKDVLQLKPDGSLSLVGQVQQATDTPLPAASPLPSRTLPPTQAPTMAVTATPAALASSPPATPSAALGQLSTPPSVASRTPTVMAPAPTAPALPAFTFPRTFIAVALLGGLCIIFLAAVAGIGLSYWYTRRGKNDSQHIGSSSKEDRTP